jgi:MFS family permease
MLPLDPRLLDRRPDLGRLSDRFGSRPFATVGMLVAASVVLLARALAGRLQLLRVRRVLLFNGLAMGAFAAPNRAGVMNSLPRSIAASVRG